MEIDEKLSYSLFVSRLGLFIFESPLNGFVYVAYNLILRREPASHSSQDEYQTTSW